MEKWLIVVAESGLLLLFAACAMTTLVAPSSSSLALEGASLAGLVLLAARRAGLHRRLVPARFVRDPSRSR